MLLQCSNKPLINGREKTYLTVAAATAATALTVISTDLAPAGTSSNTWADNDYMIVGELGQEGTEVMQMAAAVTTATSLTIDREGQSGGLRQAHPIGTPVYRIPFNQVAFYNNSADTSTGAALLSTVNLKPDSEYTIYDDSTNTTGYGFTRYKNATSGAFSSYSDGVNYEESGVSSSRDPKTLFGMRRKVRQLLDENKANSKLTDSMIDEAINDKQREVAHITFWSFYEYVRSLSAVAKQFAYDIPTTVQKVHGVRFDTQPLVSKNSAEWDILNWDFSSTVSLPSYFSVFNSQLKLHPKPTSSATSTTLNSDITVAVTTIPVVDASDFKQGDYFRFIMDSEVIYATGSTLVETTLTAAVALVDVTISVSDTTGFAAAGTIVIDSDVITYTGKTATSFTGVTGITATHTSGETVSFSTFTGCLRGQEGTTAATHTAAADITERGIVFTCHVEPTDLINQGDRTAIPEAEILTYGAACDLATFVGKKDMITTWFGIFEKRVKELKDKYSSKQSQQFGRIKDMSERVSGMGFVDPNKYPQNINL